MPENKSHYVGVRIPNDLYLPSKQVTKLERRSMSNYIITLIEADLRKRGFLNGPSNKTEPSAA